MITKPPTFVTIGVYGSTKESFFAVLQQANVDTFCDIRQRRGVRGKLYTYANSQRLQDNLAQLGIRYLHRKDLAPSKAIREQQYAKDAETKTGKRDRSQLSDEFIQAYCQECLCNFDPQDLLDDLPPMKVLIVAKTRRGSAACVGGITAIGKSVRLIDPTDHEQAGQEYNVGEVWQIDGEPAAQITPPHTENFIVRRARRLPDLVDLVSIIEHQMPPHHGPPHNLFDELCQTTASGSLYIANPSGIPTHSTTFWRPDVDLIRADEERRIRYRYSYQAGDARFPNGCTLVFVGYQDPLPQINAGTLLRVSMSHWWTPPQAPNTEPRCYVQLSGWFETDLRQGKAKSARTFPLAHSVAKPLSPIVDDGSPISWPAFNSATDENLVCYPFEDEDDGDSFADESNVYLIHDVNHQPPHEILKSVFGYDEFRPHQLEIIQNILNRRDTLVVMPTGGGKSLCYQLPALLIDGLTVVVSPLISLMQDQVNQLRALEIPAVYLNSTLTNDAYLATAQQVRDGESKLLYLAPETLLRPETLVLLDQSNLQALIIDEAHCISQWGHDFRPEYRQIVTLRDRFPHAVCAALTATATPRVQDDIKQTLEMSNDDTFIAGFDRPNLYIGVQTKRDLFQQTVDFVAQHPQQSGIIYCNTRQRVDDLSATLNQSGFTSLPYHGGLETSDHYLFHQSGC